MRLFSLLLLCTLWSLSALPNNAAAALFGPSNFSACILENIDPAGTRTATNLIYASCKSKFPDTKDVSGGLGFFGPSDFDECIFKYASGIREKGAGILIHRSCRTLYPEETTSKTSSSARRDILLDAAAVAGKYVTAARTLDEVRASNCREIAEQHYLPDAQTVVRQVLAEFPDSEKPKVQAGLEQMYRDLPSPYAKFGGIDAYIGQLADKMSKDAACGVVWGEVSSMMGTSESEWADARAKLITIR